jgi:hypothetical protein
MKIPVYGLIMLTHIPLSVKTYINIYISYSYKYRYKYKYKLIYMYTYIHTYINIIKYLYMDQSCSPTFPWVSRPESDYTDFSADLQQYEAILLRDNLITENISRMCYVKKICMKEKYFCICIDIHLSLAV